MSLTVAGALLTSLCTLASVRLRATPVDDSGVQKVERSAQAMGSTFSVEIYGANRTRGETAAEDALAEARRVDGMLSNYIPNSELSQLNRHAADAAVGVSPELFALLTACQNYSRESDGSFDITVGPLMRTWGFFRDSGHLPRTSEVITALQKVGYTKVKLDPKHDTVSFKTGGVNLDPGGVGKGYAVDRMVAVLKSEGITAALVSAGGSSIYGLGVPPSDSRGWYVEIRDGRDETKVAATVYLHNQSISTSGSYEKFFWADGKLYSHIMDPRTGFPAEGMISVSVISPLTLDSEVWAKPFYIRGRAWTEAHKPRDSRVLMCEDKPGDTCTWLP